jgi:hypothetical protein
MRRLVLVLLALAALAVAAPAFGASGTLVEEPLSFSVDDSLTAVSSENAAVADPQGTVTQFRRGELILQTESREELSAFLERWHGEVLGMADASELKLEGVPTAYLVHIDVGLADPDELERDLEKLDVPARGPHHFSDKEAWLLVAAATREAAAGLSVGLNFVAEPHTFRTRKTTEAATGPSGWSPDAYKWLDFSKGSTQDIAVGEAWNLLARAGRIPTTTAGRIAIGILDNGFNPTPTADLPAGSTTVGAGASSVPCSGGTSCPWHGANVTDVALGLADNSFGAAGTGGPVALAIQRATPLDVFGAMTQMNAARAAGARIMNTSFGGGVAAVVGSLAGPWDTYATAMRNTGAILIASAGNSGTDVDALDCFVTCWESAYWWPCEAAATVCVGGLGNGSKARHSSSNFSGGTNVTGSGTVDIYAPWFSFAGPDPQTSGVQTFSGTSNAAPFTSGVAALIWAADPAQTAAQVESRLLSTAQPGTGVVGSYVDAEAGVEAALGDLPPDIAIDLPTANQTVNGTLHLKATASDREDGVPLVSWFANGTWIGQGTDTYASLSNLAPGTYLIEASAVDSHGWTVPAAAGGVTITYQPSPPQLTITSPGNGTTYAPTDTIWLIGTSADPLTATQLPNAQVRWYVDGILRASGHSASLSASTLTLGQHVVRFEGTNSAGIGSATVTINVQQGSVILPPGIAWVLACPGQPAPGVIYAIQGTNPIVYCP